MRVVYNMEDNINIIQIAERLEKATSREEGQSILNEKKYTLSLLKLLAIHVGVSAFNGLKKADLIDKIIQHTIGYRVDADIIQNWKREKREMYKPYQKGRQYTSEEIEYILKHRDDLDIIQKAELRMQLEEMGTNYH